MSGVSDRTGVDTRYKVAVTTARHRLVLWPETGETALFDLEADPGEQRDVSLQQPEVLAGMREQLEAWMDLGDRLPGEAAPPDVARALEGLGYLGGK